MSRETLTLTALALFMVLAWAAAFVACILSTNPLAIGFWMVCGIVNGCLVFDVAEHAVESHVEKW